MKVGGRQELWLAVGVIEWLWPVTVQLMPSEEGAGVRVAQACERNFHSLSLSISLFLSLSLVTFVSAFAPSSYRSSQTPFFIFSYVSV